MFALKARVGAFEPGGFCEDAVDGAPLLPVEWRARREGARRPSRSARRSARGWRGSRNGGFCRLPWARGGVPPAPDQPRPNVPQRTIFAVAECERAYIGHGTLHGDDGIYDGLDVKPLAASHDAMHRHLPCWRKLPGALEELIDGRANFQVPLSHAEARIRPARHLRRQGRSLASTRRLLSSRWQTGQRENVAPAAAMVTWRGCCHNSTTSGAMQAQALQLRQVQNRLGLALGTLYVRRAWAARSVKESAVGGWLSLAGATVCQFLPRVSRKSLAVLVTSQVVVVWPYGFRRRYGGGFTLFTGQFAPHTGST